MNGPRRRHAVTFLLVAGLLLLGIVGVAQAGPPPDRVSPIDCLNEWTANDNYVGDGWVRARVAVVDNVVLACGDEMSGVIHIAHPETNGTRHPVSASEESFFLRCFESTVKQGQRQPDKEFAGTRTRITFTYLVRQSNPLLPEYTPSTATVIVDNAGRFVWTFFTSKTSAHPSSNDWGGCVGSMV